MRTLKELMNLNDRVALITGGAGHLGQAMASSLAECGATIVLVDRDREACAAAAAAIERTQSVKTLSIAVDLEKEEDVLALPSQVVGHMGRLDILVNNAAFVGTDGLDGWVVPFEQQTTQTWRRALEVNLTACFTLAREAAPYLKKSDHASIVNIGSIYGVVGPDLSLYDGLSDMGNPAAYAASKGGLLQLTRWMATVLAPHIRVNAITPGGVWRNQPDAFEERYRKRTPLGRMAGEEDFKGVIAWLASDASSYVTGQNIQIDGGWSVW